jgi:hypothetical protein
VARKVLINAETGHVDPAQKHMSADPGDAVNESRTGCGETVTPSLGDEAAACATHQFQRVGHNVCKRFGLRARQGNVDQRRDHSYQRPMQNEMGFDPPTHPERS